MGTDDDIEAAVTRLIEAHVEVVREVAYEERVGEGFTGAIDSANREFNEALEGLVWLARASRTQVLVKTEDAA